ncbi:uncharacterized protein N7446_013449 [Penicillium canescens]|uniref:DNA polymerase n=1 Tax=Penicillium canescens TaxID=5083 RepID=A0AAD6N296_PENCN|nr:uncharacterized protein N7446_013449 [Penicillium canescens]KAJ6023095.1 hypothetical protein N7460_013490 [Penicillium canescens]KAJ6025640.1 hypothetical protein N7444_013319 [Penicillium canescens]KAJ6042383.1 hypothetical protein N7446_013449 [Penicillium canescens]
MSGTHSKEDFFVSLEQLDDSDDQDEEYNEWERLLYSTKYKAPDKVAPTPVAERISLSRAHSDPQPTSRTNQYKTSTLPDDSKPAPLIRHKTTGAMPTTKSGGPPQKKRRTNSAKVIPECQKIFKDLVFFFFPNNDVSPFRRLRIQRAQEYGAQWSRAWEKTVTHAVVDNDLLLNDLLGYIKLESLPASVVLVNESYPSDCIQFRSLLNPSQLRFRVHGVPKPTGEEKKGKEKEQLPLVVEPSSLNDLPLRPSRREQALCPESSQPSVEEDSPAATTEPAEEFASEEGHSRIIRERDALDDIIDQAKATSHLPLDPLESPDHTATTSDDGIPSGSEPGSEILPQKELQRKGKADWTKNFSCMQKYDPDEKLDNPNSRTIEVLQQMLDYYTQTADHWRARALPGIGERIADKIEEIVLTNRLRRLEHTNDTPEDRLIQEFLGVYGAGLIQASKWVAQGYKSLADLLEKAPLSKQQRIGVERYNDFAQRIPRKEVEAHGAIVRKAVQIEDRDMQVIISGSYRRGAATCGDIDCLITKPGATLDQIRSIMLGLVVPKLFRSGFLQASLTLSSHQDGSKWHGASTIPGSNLWRRIDLLFVPDAEIGAALLYFTGNDIFNRSMRLLARKKGMCLNQKGLFTNILRTQQVKLNAGRLVEARNERRIFAALGVPWRPPEHRIC